MKSWSIVLALVLASPSWAYTWKVETTADWPVGSQFSGFGAGDAYEGSITCSACKESLVRDLTWYYQTPDCGAYEYKSGWFGKACDNQIPFWIDRAWEVVASEEINEGVHCLTLSECGAD